MPGRAELFNVAQMEQLAQALAKSHQLDPGHPPDRLLDRLADNRRVLTDACELLTAAVKDNLRIAPAGEWLLDNFYLIEEQIRTTARHLPKGYSRELPRLLSGPSAQLPRVYDIALETISHNDGRVDPESLNRFVAAYQSVNILTLGELWAIPIMLRLALIENLRRVAVRVAGDRLHRNLANSWADQMIGTVEKDPQNLILVIADMARSNPPLVSSFVAELTRRLQGQGPTLALALTWVEQQLVGSSLTIEALVRLENQQQAADQVSMGNGIGSLRSLGTMDWPAFVELSSVVERTLGEDPAGVYARMDFSTRDRYRHIVESLSRHSPACESAVARAAVDLAKTGAETGGVASREAHVGYYLIDQGLPRLEQAIRWRAGPLEALRRIGRRFPLTLYLGSILVITALLAGGLIRLASTDGLSQGWLWPFGLLGVLCAGSLAIALTNWLATLASTPTSLPRMDFSKGIPAQFRTLVVVPTMLTSEKNLEHLAEALEVRFLANRDEHLHFCLLTDLVDAGVETLPEDEPLLQAAGRKLRELNEKYPGAAGDSFFLFHRPRLWNPKERLWMGEERKRGKLADLNALLRGKGDSRFSLIAGDPSVLREVKYVITLDTDTGLARDTARQFVGTMAHPLNRPVYDPRAGRVVSGYGILQPRVAVALSGASRSRYARMFTSELGIDPYTRAVSDVYQDLFGEGSFIGKGIYDVDAFEEAVGGRFPDNLILSHDLLEGCHARCGLLSDVQLYEENPSRYASDVARRHRWIRGDWQIVRWLFPGIPGADGHLHRNPLSPLSRWKIFDNLRRSLTPAALVMLFLLGWTRLSPAWLWTLAGLGILLIPSLTAAAHDFLRKPAEMTLAQHLGVTRTSTARFLERDAFTLASLPHEAFYSLDAIARTLWRLFLSRRRLLEWNPSTSPAAMVTAKLSCSVRHMWFAPVFALATAVSLALWRPDSLPVAGPILALWFASPALAWWVSRPQQSRDSGLSSAQILFLEKLSRKTWAFFETFVGPDDHWLIPDNFQETPAPVTAHRTSPTNLGMALLANCSAFDFGYIGAGNLLDRTARTLASMETLERHRGHFYNWYDTQTCKPLVPLYISSVDSGNLAGHLLTLRQALLALPALPIFGERQLDGLVITWKLLLETAGDSCQDLLVPLQRELDSMTGSRPLDLRTATLHLGRLAAEGDRFAAALEAMSATPDEPLIRWARTFTAHCKDALSELAALTPWLDHPEFLRQAQERPGLVRIPTLLELAAPDAALSPRDDDAAPTLQGGPAALAIQLRASADFARSRISAVQDLAARCATMAVMDYEFLYDPDRHLLSIGYNVPEQRRDSSCYDLLASEARFASFVAIAQGKLEQETWFAMGRLLTSAGADPILLSWSGSMFEYLMPLLVMPTYEHTLLDQTCRAAVARQIDYGRSRGVPWGVSESGYNAIDVHFNYQYRAFGVPGLGLKRGLAEDLVIAPYATALALMVAPGPACRNLQRLAGAGCEGRFGFYEAIDYTPSHLPRGQSSAVIRSFMAHHQGMTLLSLAHVLLDRPMQQRFEADASFQATLLLLQERLPQATTRYAHTTELAEHVLLATIQQAPILVHRTPDTPNPQTQLLSNGRYHVMVTNAGGGYSMYKDLAITRWREDNTCDDRGAFCYLRDVATSEVWSTTLQPTRKHTKNFEAIFSEGRAEFRCRHLDYDLHTELAVSPEDDIELRRTRITNRGRTRRTVEFTSYAEVVLAPPVSDQLHPAFSNLFVQTEIIEAQQAILCNRRPRSVGESSPWMMHLMAVHGARVKDFSYETDRMRFLGRGNTSADPAAMHTGSGVLSGSGGLSGSGVLSGTDGSVLDPIVAVRCRITLDPEESATVNLVFGLGQTRLQALELVEKYQDWRLADRVFDLSWTHGQVLLRQLNATEAEGQLYGRLANSILTANAAFRADPGVLIRNRRGQSGLWGYAISGDHPIVLLKIEDPENIELVRQLVAAHAYWRLKGLVVDLVIWNEDHAGYRQALHDSIMGLIAAGIDANDTDRPGGIFVRPGDQIAEEDRVLIQAVARVIISDTQGTLEEQIGGRVPPEVTVPLLTPTLTAAREVAAPDPLPRTDLQFFNGLGGFTGDGREYIITTAPGHVTPAPWVNILANARFGAIVSESGPTCTWSENAHEFRLTPWSNDPVCDTPGEAFYLRDEETGRYWSPTPLPCRGATPYVTRHGFGYSVFEHTEQGLRSEMWVYVALDAPIKFTVLKVHNQADRPRRLTLTGYAEWVLGDLRPKSAMHVVTELDPKCGALFARNPYNPQFSDRTAFFDADLPARTVTGDRAEFLGRNGQLQKPAAMKRVRLSGRVGAALDPCAAMQVAFELAPGEEREFVFRLGAGANVDDARNLVHRFRGSHAAREALDAVWHYWSHTLGAVQVETPSRSLDMLANGWLLYQTLACRMMGRGATYQSGGAFGFRDQLQDAMALVTTAPQRLREHLLLCASRQFEEGDVQHWWHPPTGQGVRTHCSDDYLWLPLATCRYVHTTGDTGVLDEPVHFLRGRLVGAEEDSYYDLPARSADAASLYEHCVRAIRHGLRTGAHGLPLMGSGDWNDGMNLVGGQGLGESVWLGFFLHEVLTHFAEVARQRGDGAFAHTCVSEAARVARALDAHGWDGLWYRRAYFDDGTPLGSAENPECQIDSIAQSWAVLSAAGDPKRAKQAMEMVDLRLVRRDHGLVLLLDPPFDKSDLNPGYIKGYVPGVRENGGQYTHAAIWAAMAFARLKDPRRAWELFTMIDPIAHARTLEAAELYKVEPYVMAADVYGAAPHTGRGGWTWYTGSAAWMYRLITESLLGLRLTADQLHFSPCLPPDWEGFTMHYRYRETVYHIRVVQVAAPAAAGLTVDGASLPGPSISMVDDHREHFVEVRVPK